MYDCRYIVKKNARIIIVQIELIQCSSLMHTPIVTRMYIKFL